MQDKRHLLTLAYGSRQVLLQVSSSMSNWTKQLNRMKQRAVHARKTLVYTVLLRPTAAAAATTAL